MHGEKNKRRNGEIDFLRFIFGIIIVLHHSRYLVGDDRCLFLGGSLVVEFFFIVSGYLMMMSVEKASVKDNEILSLGKETQWFIMRKLSSFLPELLTAQTIALTITCIATHETIRGGIRLLINSFWDLCLVRMSGLLVAKMNGVTWYISSMLICMSILYPLLRKYKDMMIHVIIPLIVLFGMGFLCQQYGNPRDPSKWIGWTFKGNIRAFSELSLGVLCYYAAGWLSRLSLSHFGKIIVTFTEVFSYAVTVYYMYAKKPSTRDYIFILILFVAITITFSEQSMLLTMLNNRYSYLLGKFSVCIYFSHVFYAQHLKKLLPVIKGINIAEQIEIYIVISIATAVIVYLVAEWIRKYKVFHNVANVFIENA